MRRMILVVIGLLFIGSVLQDSPGFAGEIEERKKQYLSMRGLKKAIVKVRIGMSFEGPTRRLLQADIERRLKEIPLHILSEEDSKALVPAALVVEVAMMKSGIRSSVHFVTARLFQPVLLKRNQELSTYGATWIAYQMGEGDMMSIRENIGDLLDRFINDYKWANSSS